MAEYLNYGQTQWARTVHTTLAQNIRDEEVETLRNFKFLALLEANGRISYNETGQGITWPVRYKLHAVEGNTGATQRNFTRTNQWQTAALPWRGYQVKDSIDRDEMLANRGQEAIIKVSETMEARLRESIKQGLGLEVFIDGEASGNETRWHGLESMFGGTETVNASTGANRAANAADIVLYPNDTYAGLSTVLGNYGGDNETGSVWPNGVADSEYDFWTPLVVNYTSTHADLPAATDTWAGQGDEALRFGIIHSQRNTSTNGPITTAMLNRSLYLNFLNIIDNKEQINVTSTNDLRALGFKDVVVFDGVEVTWEVGVPTTRGYGFNIRNVKMKCREEAFFTVDGPHYDWDAQRWVTAVDALGNLQMESPRNFVKWDDIA